MDPSMPPVARSHWSAGSLGHLGVRDALLATNDAVQAENFSYLPPLLPPPEDEPRQDAAHGEQGQYPH